MQRASVSASCFPAAMPTSRRLLCYDPRPMKCIQISKPGGPEVLVPAERPNPVPKAPEILIKVAAAGVNRPDVQQRLGKYAPPADASDLPGLEVAGEVAAIGEDVKMWKVGDKVCALVHGGGYA